MTATQKRLVRIAMIALQWLFLTTALGAFVVYSADTLEDFLSPNLASGIMFFAAFALAFLLGISVESFKILMPLAVLMCVGAAFIFVMVVFAPSYAGVTVRTTQLENYATTRALLFAVLMLLPAVVGAGFGNLAGGHFRDDILPDDGGSTNFGEPNSWYERRNHSSTPLDADSSTPR